jgi:uncharacterized protein (DUF736 family)
MSFEHKPGSLSLFKNEKKGNDRAPDYRGSGKDLNGNEVEISAWVKTGSGGAKFMSLQMKPPFEKSEKPASKPAVKSFDELSDDIPF